MSGPEPIANFLQPKLARCRDCGQEFQSVGCDSVVTWRRCEACSAKHVAERTAAIAAQEQARADYYRLEAEQAVIEERARIVAALAVPPLYADVTLASFQRHGTGEQQATQARLLAFAERYAVTFPTVPRIAAFIGAPGSGKGHVAWSLAKRIAESGKTAKVVKLADMVRTLRAAWSKQGEDSEIAALERFRTPAFLVIDEVSRHAFYGQPVQHLYDVIDHRDEQLRPTILTTNETDAGLAEVLGAPLLNRIEGAGGMIDFGSASWRSRVP